MNYGFSKTLEGVSFDTAIEKITDALKEKGFGILTQINVQATLKKKIDVDFYPYQILGACNPRFAYEALQKEEHIGLMLPCNVIVRQTTPNAVEISVVDPVASMKAVENPELLAVATQVQTLLKEVLEGVL